MSSHVYEIIKTIYSGQTGESDDSTRLSVIQSTLGQLRLANIATLDAITTHFTRLIELTSADETYISRLATTLAPCILRPRTESSLTAHERCSYRLLRDLLANKEAIFGELKRASTLSQIGSGSNRARAVSTDERHRRAHVEARNQAIMSRSRASSPQPNPGRTHRRDRSTGGASTRFPIQTSPPIGPDRKGPRQSLEVPGSAKESPSAEGDFKLNGSALNDGVENVQSPDEQADGPANANAEVGIDKRNSLGRSGKVQRRVQAGHPGRQSLPLMATKRDSLNGQPSDKEQGETTAAAARPVGVTLVDKSYDDSTA